MGRLVQLSCPDCESENLELKSNIITCTECDYKATTIRDVKLCYELEDEE